MASYLSGIGKPSPSGVIDFLFSAGYTFYFGGKTLLGLQKISVVFGRGVDAGLKTIGFDTSKKDSWAGKIAGWVPERFTMLVTPDLNYNRTNNKEIDVPKTNEKGQPIDKQGKVVKDPKDAATEKKIVEEYEFSNSYMLASGLALTLLGSFMLAAKFIAWRPSHPLLNSVLIKIGGVKLVPEESGSADLINAGIAAVRSRIS